MNFKQNGATFVILCCEHMSPPQPNSRIGLLGKVKYMNICEKYGLEFDSKDEILMKLQCSSSNFCHFKICPKDKQKRQQTK
jgi:hypothetical protein